jgi:replicative DNA helicase
MTISTGLTALDDLIGGGLQPGSLTLYAGTSQSGMTTLLDTTVCAAAFKHRVPTLLADLEAGDRQARILSAHSGVNLLATQRGTVSAQEAEALATSMKAAAAAPLRHTDSRDLPHLLAESMDIGALLIAIDGARYVTPGPGGRSDLHQILVSLKELARSQDAAIIITTPINRDHVRPGNTPTVELLAPEFGLNCDTVVVIERWGWPAAKSETEPVDLIVAKNRYGLCGRVRVVGDYLRARLLDEDAGDNALAA